MTRSRADLASLGYGRSSFAFRIPPRDRRGELHRHRRRAAATCSPVRAGRGIFDGFTDIGDGHLDGWVTERCDDRRRR